MENNEGSLESGPFEAYKKKMGSISAKKKRIVNSITRLTDKFKDLEAEAERLSDEEFERANIITWKESFSLTITEENMLQDLIKRTEGTMIKPEQPNLN